MENQLVWKEEYNIGVDVIDKEHQRLFKIINKLFAFGKEEKKSQWQEYSRAVMSVLALEV